jgi:DNA-binding XRE family transcriptional regulator
LKPQKQKTEFIMLRAEGKSYSAIAEQLHISKSTCTAWERELKDNIAELKQEQLEELYNSYFMTKEARIRKLGDTLENINTALEGVDLSTVAPEKLLDYKLKYMEALKEEYTGNTQVYRFCDEVRPQDIVAALRDLLNRVRAGDITPEQANRESSVIVNLLRAYDVVEVKAKLDTLEAIMGGRRG